MQGFLDRIGDVPVLTDAEGIRERSLDTYWKAAALARDGRALLPDAVVRPRTAEEVASTLAAAAAGLRQPLHLRLVGGAPAGRRRTRSPAWGRPACSGPCMWP